jgi:hypothetical protein
MCRLRLLVCLYDRPHRHVCVLATLWSVVACCRSNTIWVTAMPARKHTTTFLSYCSTILILQGDDWFNAVTIFYFYWAYVALLQGQWNFSKQKIVNKMWCRPLSQLQCRLVSSSLTATIVSGQFFNSSCAYMALNELKPPTFKIVVSWAVTPFRLVDR